MSCYITSLMKKNILIVDDDINTALKYKRWLGDESKNEGKDDKK
jgi:hypothetical protein